MHKLCSATHVGGASWRRPAFSVLCLLFTVLLPTATHARNNIRADDITATNVTASNTVTASGITATSITPTIIDGDVTLSGSPSITGSVTVGGSLTVTDTVTVSKLAYSSAVSQTIASGEITPTTAVCPIVGDGWTDDTLVSINAWSGELIVYPFTSTHTIYVTHGTAANQIQTPDAQTFTMPATGGLKLWREAVTDPWLMTGATSSSLTADNVTVEATPSNYTAATADVEAHLAGIDTQLGAQGQASEITVAASPSTYTAATADVEAHLTGIDSAIRGLGSGGYVATSSTSLTIGTGSQTLTTQTDLSYSIGARVRVSYTSDATNYMEGLITDYTPTATQMVIDVDLTGGSGTYASWNINLTGEPATVLEHEFIYPAGSFTLPDSNPAPLGRDSGTNGTIYYHAFDDTTEEFVEGTFRVPQDVDTTGTVTFTTIGYSATAAASKYIQWQLGHSAAGDSDTWDTAYTDEDSGDKALDATQDDLDHLTWTETVSNLGWSAGDFVRFRLSRIAPSGTDLTGDYYLVMFTVRIPRN